MNLHNFFEGAWHVEVNHCLDEEEYTVASLEEVQKIYWHRVRLESEKRSSWYQPYKVDVGMVKGCNLHPYHHMDYNWWGFGECTGQDIITIIVRTANIRKPENLNDVEYVNDPESYRQNLSREKCVPIFSV